MIRFITATLDSFLPAAFRGDPDAESRGRVLVRAAWGSALACGLTTVSRLVIAPFPAGPFAVAVLATLLFATAPFVLRATGRLRLAGDITCERVIHMSPYASTMARGPSTHVT